MMPSLPSLAWSTARAAQRRPCRRLVRALSSLPPGGAGPASLPPLFAELREHGRAFPVRGEGVEMLAAPAGFYAALVEGIEAAESHITLASLYLGTGSHELRMVQCLRSSLLRKPELRLTVMLDATRGTRQGADGASSAGVLAPLVEEFPGQVQVGLFLAPQLWSGPFSSRRLPSKVREVRATQHLKAYVFDDTLLMSGANLSKDYFTNRQDRYILLRDAAALADHYHLLCDSLMPFCDQVAGPADGEGEGESGGGGEFPYTVERLDRVRQRSVCLPAALHAARCTLHTHEPPPLTLVCAL